ncbi:MAG: hypothetical protein NDI69_00680 [Bacteriovoracaceae bacterium]|nr:hypothetical protein [Bacteriovoracaceae bacterium]
MTQLLIQFFLSASAIVVAGIFLARAADDIGEFTKMGRLLAGSIFLAGATSLPELLIDISAINKGMPDLAVGDLMGSSLINLLILAVADLFSHSPHKMFSRSGAQHALSASVSINMTIFAVMAILLGPELSRFGIGEIGLGPLLIGCAYILGIRLVYYDQQFVSKTKEPSSGTEEKKGSLARAFSVYFLCALTIFIAAPYLADSAGKIADITGLGKTFIGTTLVAFCTSLPEVVSTFAAVRMGAFELAVGNIFGSNSFNMILLIPLDFVQPGNLLGMVSRSHIMTGLTVILATSVAVMGQLYHEEKRKKFIEPDALTVILIVLGAFAALYFLK